MNLAFRSLAGGEIAPALHGRTDQLKYQTGAKTLRNFIVQRSGGIANRPGTEFIVEVKDSSKTVRLVPFIFNAEQTYVLEFGEGYIRFIREGAQLEVTGTPYEISSPYLEDELMDLQFVQSADVITIVHPNHAPRELSRTAHTAWTLTTIEFGASIGSVENLAMADGTAGGPTYYAVTAIDATTGEEGLPAFVNDALEATEADPITLTWDPLLGAERYIVYRSTDGGSTYEEIAGAGGTPTTMSATTWTDDEDTATTTGVLGVWVPSGTFASIDVITGGANKPFDERFTVKGVCDASIGPSGNGSMGARVRAFYKRDAESRVDAGIVGTSGVGSGESSNETFFTSTITVPDNGYTGLTLEFQAEVIHWWEDTDTAECTAIFDSGLAPYDRIEWNTMGSGFIDDGSAGDPLSTPPLPRVLFDQADRYPAAVGIYQQRRLFGNTNERPEETYASRTGAYANFLISNPLQDDDAVTWSMAGRQVNRVLHYLDLKRLIVFTSGSEMQVQGDEAGILRPGAINPESLSYNGSSVRPPLPIDKQALFLQARGTRVRALVPDGSNNFDSNDLSIFASHLFDSYTIEDWAYAQTPHSIVWAVRSDGVLLGLTYLPSHEVWGWHRHDTQGTIERVCVIPEDDEDVLYLVVLRTIDGEEKRYIERLSTRYVANANASDGVFMDSALSYSGAPATNITGLDHLEGEDVSVLADGVVVANPNDSALAAKTVTGGAITLATPASLVHVGLPYLSDLETLDIDTPSGRSLKEFDRLVNKVRYVVEKSREFYTGRDAPANDATDPKQGLVKWQRKVDDAASPAVLTRDVEVVIESSWSKGGRVFARVLDPVPVTILAVIPQGHL